MKYNLFIWIVVSYDGYNPFDLILSDKFDCDLLILEQNWSVQDGTRSYGILEPFREI